MMTYLAELSTAFMTALALENLLFARAIDIPRLYDRRSIQQIVYIGLTLTVINAVGAIPSYFVNRFLGSKPPLSDFMTPAQLCVNILVLLVIYFLIRRFSPKLFSRVGESLPFYGVNCVTLGTLMVASRMSSSTNFFSFFGYCVGAGVGFMVALLLLWSVRQRLSMTRIPKTFRGLPITLLSLGIISLALFGLLGNQLPA